MSRILLIALFVAPIFLAAQSPKIKGDRAFESLKYQEAIEYYSDFLKKKKDYDAQKNLAEAYFFTNDFPNAEIAFRTLMEDYDPSGKMILKYAEVLIINDRKKLASEILEEYIQSHPSTDEYKRLFSSLEIDHSTSTKYRYEISKASFGSELSDFCPQYFEDKIVFTSLRGGKRDPWTGSSYSQIYMAEPTSSQSEVLPGNLNGKFHNGAVTFMDEETLVFTRNSSSKGAEDDYNLILAFAKMKNGQWKYDSEYDHNDQNYSNAYPCYIHSTKTLIFASDQPGGYGGMDLYSSQYQSGQWSTPQNLGPQINTSGDDVFPTCNDDKTLYFASNGRPGMGGLDLFSTLLSTKDEPKVVHLSAPLNSTKDDFGLITRDDLSTGYFSSNRSNDGRIDHIYSFSREIVEAPPQSIKIAGKVVDEYTRLPLKETTISLENTEKGDIQVFTTGDDGRFEFEAMSGESYLLTGTKNQIPTTSETLDNTSPDQTHYYTLLHNDPRFSLEGVAVKNNSQEGVQDVQVTCFNTGSLQSQDKTTSKDGSFKFQLDQDSDFEISGSKDGYFTSISEASTKGLNRSKTLYVKLYLNIEEVVIGETKVMGQESFGGFEFDPVYYDLDEDAIRPDAAQALDKVVEFLQTNPTISIELGSHTDSRGSAQYNQKLSQRRAQSAVQYIVSQGIEQDRITAQGYGEYSLANNCADGITCTESEHQLNRRTEIKITKIKAR